MKTQIASYDQHDGWTGLNTIGSADLVILFGSSGLIDHQDVIEDVAAAAPHAAFIGCSTAGEIIGSEVRDGCAILAAVEFASTPVRVAACPISTTSSYEAGRAIADALDDEGLKAVFILSEGLDVNGSELVRGVDDRLSGVVITGGLAADGDRFERTWVIADGRLTQQTVSAIGFYGDSIHIGHGSMGGWDVFGPERVVTRSEGNVVFEIDNRPALALYKEYLGDLADGLPSTGLLFPLSVRRPGESSELVRTILGIDEEAQSLTFAGDIPTGHHATLMHANFDRLVEGAEVAARLTKTPATTGSMLSIAISCVGRRLVLGTRVEEETEATLSILPSGIDQIGFYSYGEISPLTSGVCDLHNQTMTLTTIAETP